MITVADVQFDQASHWALTDGYYSISIDKKLKIQWTAKVARKKNGIDLGRTNNWYFLDGVTKAFKTLEEAVCEYNKLQNK